MVKDAPHLFSSLVIMNTGIPTGFDFAERKELLKVLSPLIIKSCSKVEELISFKNFHALCFEYFGPKRFQVYSIELDLKEKV